MPKITEILRKNRFSLEQDLTRNGFDKVFDKPKVSINTALLGISCQMSKIFLFFINFYFYCKKNNIRKK